MCLPGNDGANVIPLRGRMPAPPAKMVGNSLKKVA